MSTQSILLSLLAVTSAIAAPITGKFCPPEGKVLVFIGQDNASVGGTAAYKDGYVDNVGVPAGITHYVYFAEGWTNGFGRTFPMGMVAGLNTESEWASGPMSQKAYVDSPTLDPCVMHLSIAMEGNNEDNVASGKLDHLIAETVDFLRDHPDHPFIIRPGYEFDGKWNNYDPVNFKKAFRRIVDKLREANLDNWTMCLASASSVKTGQFEKYDPGAEYYDWVGYSWWGGRNDGQAALDFARKVGKPVFIAEATPRKHYFDKEDPETIWKDWFEVFFKHIEDNSDVVRAVSYINADWDAQDMWNGWGQTRIETVSLIKERWLNKMAEPRYINAADKPFEVIGFTPGKRSQRGPDYKDASLPVARRVNDLLSRMTINEKVAQITAWWNPDEQKLRQAGKIFTPGFYAQNCPNGIGHLGPLHNLTIDEDAKQYAAIQKYFRTQTRLGIPAILHDEAAHGFMKFEANSFPAPIGISCSWNPELVTEIFSQVAQEARSRGVPQVLAPIVDLARDLRWGRVDETLGEDVFLVSRLGAAMVKGLQGSTDGSIPPDHVAATLKHFVGYADTEGGRNRSPYARGTRHLLDNEVEAFRHVIQTTRPSAVMAAFNEIDGLPCHVNRWVLTEVLRKRLGFEGLIVGDYQGLDLVRRYQNIGTSDADVGRMGLAAGLQLELPGKFGFKHLPMLVRTGKADAGLIDEAVREILALKFRLGLFEAPMTLDVARAKALAFSGKATELAREAARESIVVLKNEKHLLPLEPGAHKHIAVIGPNAAVCRLGGYSGKPHKTVSLLEGLRTFLGDRAKVSHAEGCKIALNDTGDSYENWRYVNEVKFATLADNRQLIDQAVALAKTSDLVVLAIGENELLAREAWSGNHLGDRSTFDLTESQQVLAKAVLDTGKPVVIFLNNAKPVTLNEIGERAPAILTAYYAGQETGTAAAEILFGRTNPSGKLSISWPRSAGHLPSYYSQNGSAQVFDYLDSPRSALYPFGFGLSYTTYGYGKPALSKRRIAAGESVDVTFTVTNKGDREGTEIAQVYVSGKGFELARPGLELKGFARVALKPGESKPVTVTLDADDLAFHGIDLVRSLKSGVFEVRVGGSSANLSAPVMLQSVADGPKEKQAASKSSGSTINDLQLAATGGAATSNGKQPNILFIAVDDLRPELGCYGSKVISPHMDRLAATGMRFDRAYCQQAVCGASRLSIMGGLYPVNTGEQNYHVTGWRRRHPDLLTLNRHLNANGYETIGLGKIYHDHIGGPEADLPNWSQWIDIGGGEYALPENIELAKQAMAKATLRRNQPPPEGPTTEAADVDDDRYKDGKRAAKAVEILRGRAAAGGKPFFLAVGFTKPHLPFAVPQKYWNLYKREDFSMPSNKGIPPGYPKAAANPDAGEMRRYTDYVGRGPGDFPDEMNLRLLHGYAAATSYADACVGRVLVALEETGLAKNTIVVLWGDHGWKLGDHSSWCKHTNFECDTRVPLIVRDPRVAGGKSTQSLVELIDLYPTLCDLADIPVPAHCQGRSFSRLLADPTAGHRDDAYSSYPAGNGMGHSLRFGIYRYTEWHDNDTGAVNARVLTDLVADPGEVTNVLENPTLAETVRQASSRLNERIGKARSGKP